MDDKKKIGQTGETSEKVGGIPLTDDKLEDAAGGDGGSAALKPPPDRKDREYLIYLDKKGEKGN